LFKLAKKCQILNFVCSETFDLTVFKVLLTLSRHQVQYVHVHQIFSLKFSGESY